MAFDNTAPIVAPMLMQENEALVASLLALNAPLSLVCYIQQLAREGWALRHVPEALRPAAQTAFAHRVLAACATLTVYRQQFSAVPRDAALRAQFTREQAQRVLVIPVMHTWLAAQEPCALVGQRLAWPRHSPFADILHLFTGWRWDIAATTACLVDDSAVAVALPHWARVFMTDLGRWCRQHHQVTIAAGDALHVLARSVQLRVSPSTFPDVITAPVPRI